MQKTIILILILFSLFCRDKKYSKIWGESKPFISNTFFLYGVKPTELGVNPDKLPSWGPSLKASGESICINSHDDFLRSKEYGPSFGVCIEATQENQSLLESALQTLNDLDESKLRPDGYLTHEGAKLHLHFLSTTEIVNEIYSAKERSFFIGDNRLHSALEKRMDLSFENYKSIAGSRENKIETSFSLSYFSIYIIDKTVKIVFPPLDSGIARSQFHYLAIDVTNVPEFISNFQTIFANMKTINDTWTESCSHEKLEITEVMGYASGTTKRFIEWSGSKENPTCLDKITLDISDKKVDIESNSPFLFPGAVKLFVEEDSPLQGVVLKDANWRGIRSSSVLKLNTEKQTEIWTLPENVSFKWSQEEFSLKRKIHSCQWANSIIRNAKFCGDPGLEIEATTLADNNSFGNTNTATTSVTNTGTSTSTSSVTSTGTSTSTSSVTSTGTSTSTSSVTNTGTSTSTNLVTNTGTSTSTSSVTNTGTSTSTSSVTSTGTSTSTSSVTSTGTSTSTSSVTNTGTSTSTSSVPLPNVTLEICKPENFVLSELNALGLRKDGRLDKSGKFIELKYLGANDCKLTDLFLQIGSSSVPLYGKDSFTVKVNSYWVIADSKNLTGIENLIRRNLDFILWEDSIVLQNDLSKNLLWNGFKPEEVFLPESMEGKILSIDFESGKFSHHPSFTSIYLSADIQSSHIMSPGEANPKLSSDLFGELSEILWAGSYKNSTSVPDDKFVELKTRGEGTLELEISTSSSHMNFFIPISRMDAFTVLSKGKFQCFLNAKSIVNDRFNILETITHLKLKLEGRVLSEVIYDPLKGHGTSNSTMKLRTSYVNSGIQSIWKNSTSPQADKIHSECANQIFASPDRPNEFEPFLVDEKFEYQNTGKFYLATSVYEQNFPFAVKLYSHLPQEETTISLEKLGVNSLINPVENTLTTTGLVYQRLVNYSDLKIYNQDGVFIEGVMVVPSNAQNEWILLCNRSKISKDLIDYEIQDRDAIDRIDSYWKRKKIQLPSGLTSEIFSGNSTLLAPNQCAYLVDPDAAGINLKPRGISPTLVVTVSSTATIGNGISSEEPLDLFKYIGQEKVHVHSFGNRHSHNPFTIPVKTDEVILLLPEKRGEGKSDYEVLKW